MSENTNKPNVNNTQPNGANSVNNAPQRPQNYGVRPNAQRRVVGNFPPRQPNGFPQRPQGISARPSSQNPVRTYKQSPNSRMPGINRPSQGERFERGSKSLSHISGGASGAKLYKINRSSQDDSRRKVGGIVLDTEIIQDASKQKLADTKNKRKTVAIVILSMLLALSLAYLVVAVAGYARSGKEPNCKYYLSSEVSAHWLIEDNTETEFLVREGLANDRIYEIDSSLVINSDDSVNIKVTITATMNGGEIFISGLYEAADNMVRVDGKNTWIYVGGHQGAGEVFLFKGIDFFGSPAGLTSENVNITVSAEITKS